MSLTHSPSVVADGLYFYFDSDRLANYVGSTATSAVGSVQLTATNVTRVGNKTTFTNPADMSASISASSYLRNPLYDSQLTMRPNTSASVTFYNTSYLTVGSLSYGRQCPFSGGTDSQSGMWAFERPTQSTNFVFRYKADNSPLYGDEFPISGTVPLNTWVNLCYTNNGSLITIYVNGVAVQTHSVASKTFLAPITDCRLTIGAESTIYGFIGDVGACMFYNKSLSAAEVLQNFIALRGRFSL